jgi:AcrR family transcriptional regulator
MSKQKEDNIKTDSVQETRERIINAAYHVLAEKGYEATTLREISRAADAAQGLIHYYFGGKDQLLVEVLKAVEARYNQTLDQLAQQATTTDPLQIILQEPVDRIIEEPEWYRLRHELFALGLHNTLMAPQVRELLADGRADIVTAIKHILGETTVPPQLLASMLLALLDGLALQKIMDPDLDISAFSAVLANILRSFKVDQL